MTTSCPYCGAALNLNYCVVCGRQSNPSLNKMGTLKAVARNTDITQRLDDPLQIRKSKFRRTVSEFAKLAKYLSKLLVGGTIIAVLIWAASNQATELFKLETLIQPWMKSYRLILIKYANLHALPFNKDQQKPHSVRHRSDHPRARQKSQ